MLLHQVYQSETCSMWLNFLDLLSLQDLGSLTPRYIGTHVFGLHDPMRFFKDLLTSLPLNRSHETSGSESRTDSFNNSNEHCVIAQFSRFSSPAPVTWGGLEEGHLTPAHTNGCVVPWLNSWHLVSLQELPARRNDQQDICAPLCGSNQCLWFWLLKLLMP